MHTNAIQKCYHLFYPTEVLSLIYVDYIDYNLSMWMHVDAQLKCMAHLIQVVMYIIYLI